MKMKCQISIEFPDNEKAYAAIKSISHEGDIGKRSNAKVTQNQKTVDINIYAEDSVALRATANAYLRALQVFDDLNNTIQQENFKK